MAKKTGSKKEKELGKLLKREKILEEKHKKAVENNDDYNSRKYNHHLKLIKEKKGILLA